MGNGLLLLAVAWGSLAAAPSVEKVGSPGAESPTRNFLVHAPTPEMARRIGEWAEYHRKHKAEQWLGREMPSWPKPLPLYIKVTYNGSGGATSFSFDRGQVLGLKMEIRGTLDRLVASVLPHEVTHTIFAHHFRKPVPRWADEGAAVLSEDEPEQKRHDLLVREILNSSSRAIPLRRLFTLTEYPRDVMVLYAEGYSVSRFLVEAKDRKTFLAFIKDGRGGEWDKAARTHYGYENVDKLEAAWLRSLPHEKTSIPLTSGGKSRRELAIREFVRKWPPPLPDKSPSPPPSPRPNK
jgi:hypothetical protein